MTGSDFSHVIGNDVITGSDDTGSGVIFPRFSLTIVVVQNVPLLFVIRFMASAYSFGIFWSLCCLSFDLRLLLIPLVSFGHCVCHSIYSFWLFLLYPLVLRVRTTIVKNGRKNDVTSGHMTTITSGHVTDVTSGHVTSDHVTSGDVISGSSPFSNYDGLQVLKTVKYWSNP